MTPMTDQLRELAKQIAKNEWPLVKPLGRQIAFTIPGFVWPKERPRKGRGGHFYTPKHTRDYEQHVKECGRAAMAITKTSLMTRPVFVHLIIVDQMPKDWPDWMERIASEHIIFEQEGGDLDNKEKAVLDALNKVVWKDDRQVVMHNKMRTYGEQAGCQITVQEVGINKHDLEDLRRLVEWERLHAEGHTIQ